MVSKHKTILRGGMETWNRSAEFIKEKMIKVVINVCE